MTASAVTLAACCAIAIAIGWSTLVEPRAALSRRRRVQRLLAELGTTPSPGALARSLGTVIGDERCAVAYLLGGELIDADGEPVALVRTPDGVVLHRGEPRATTPILRDDETVALLLHDPGLVGTPGLTNRIGEAAQLAIDNERLAAALRARLRQMRDARRRLVERGDSERHDLERNLHDGAQQLMVSLAIDLRTAALDAPTGAGDALARASGEMRAALEEIRAIAHGIFPTILYEAGVLAALERLAEESPIAVEIEGDDPGRLAGASEHAAYALVREAIERTAAAGGSELAVRLGSTIASVTVQVTGAPTLDGPAADRVVAADGVVETDRAGVVATLPR